MARVDFLVIRLSYGTCRFFGNKIVITSDNILLSYHSSSNGDILSIGRKILAPGRYGVGFYLARGGTGPGLGG